ncbi:hypothetical protein QC763_300723 [Podospora pseudopauciseta]|uniref:Uncharacterized protein n=2 Tax=Podospora TaxID=5144 RepID=A0ABR0HF21_9PEZI|nr:hypothetical protein QC763_300723 [Podospora pseudopauciseta]KAK4677658.1 hypothetical protein QC764_300723 [Podospora pseudoanserina]
MTDPSHHYSNNDALNLYGDRPENYSDRVAQERDPVEREIVELDREIAHEVRKKFTGQARQRQAAHERDKAEQARASNHKAPIPYSPASYTHTSYYSWVFHHIKRVLAYNNAVLSRVRKHCSVCSDFVFTKLSITPLQATQQRRTQPTLRPITHNDTEASNRGRGRGISHIKVSPSTKAAEYLWNIRE